MYRYWWQTAWVRILLWGFQAVRPPASYFASLCLSALICKVGKVKQAPEHRIVVKMKGVTHGKYLGYVHTVQDLLPVLSV